MDKVEKRRAFLINTAYAVLLVGLFYLAVKYALGVIWPFVVAFFLAMVLQKPVNFLSKKTFLKRGAASVIMVLFMLVIIGSLLGGVIARIVIELRDFFSFLIMKLEDAPAFADQIIVWMQNTLSFLPDSMENSIVSSTADLLNKLLGVEAQAAANLPRPATESGFDLSVLSSPLGMVWGTAKQIPMIAVGVLVCIVSCCFMTSDYHNMRDMILRQMGSKKQSAIVRTKQVIFSTLGKMGKSYSIIILVTFAELSVGLLLLKAIGLYTGGYIFAIALLTAIVDILPVLGTGTILIPWAVYSFCTGKIGFGIGILVIYAIIGVVRQVIEPKLVASQLGLPPYLMLMAMFVGTQLFGFIGLFLLPITFTLIKVLNDEGIVHLFKKENAAEKTEPSAEQAEAEEALPAHTEEGEQTK